MSKMEDRIRSLLEDSIAVKQSFLDCCLPDLQKAFSLLSEALRSGRKVLICGNGGSCSDAQHFCGELVVRFRRNRSALPCIALGVDPTVLTACANDLGYETVFEREVEALGEEGDVLIGISTSGSSANVIRAVRLAKKKGLKVVSLLGGRPSELEALSDVCVKVPSESTPRIQEVHEVCLHILAELLEEELIGGQER